ncbi:SbtR family transcriptional regulator [Hafnia psychrotolerans]|nr:hypothetical protein [Hafnia psychrotolerans]
MNPVAIALASMAASSSVRVTESAAMASSMCLSDQDFQETYRQMVSVVGLFMSEREKAGEIQRGANPEDFLKLLQFLWQTSSGPEGKAQADQLLALLFRGLRARA